MWSSQLNRPSRLQSPDAWYIRWLILYRCTDDQKRALRTICYENRNAHEELFYLRYRESEFIQAQLAGRLAEFIAGGGDSDGYLGFNLQGPRPNPHPNWCPPPRPAPCL